MKAALIDGTDRKTRYLRTEVAMGRRSVMVTLALAAFGATAGASDQEQQAPDRKTFAVVFRTGPAWDSSKPPPRQKHFQAHSANIAALKTEGRLLLGGRFSDLGLILVRAADEAEARALVTRDPAVAEGTFTAEVHEWRTFAAGCLEPSGATAGPR
jgi:uncharacterized protein YciI